MTIRSDKVRAQLAAYRGADVPDSMWAFLVERRFASEVEDGALSIAELSAEVDALYAATGQGENRRREARPMVDEGGPEQVEGRERQYVRLHTLSILTALEAAQEEAVQGFRTSVLGGNLLPAEHVAHWVQTQADISGPPSLWLQGVPLTYDDILRAEPDGRGLRFKLTFFVPSRDPGITRRVLTYHAAGEATERQVATVAGSVLERLRELSAYLADRYTWSEGQASTFVLTGNPPFILSVGNMVRLRPLEALSRITLHVDPALPPREVVAVYRQIRRKVVTGRHRELSLKHLLLALVAGHKTKSNSWAKVMGEWNRGMGKQHPDWQYDQVTNFARDGALAVRRLMHPNYRLPSDEQESMDTSTLEEDNGQARTS